ncbi:nonmuscle myosin heavy chain b [Clavulina sp. PMI_390]|nr:nonmuscle myosin heavy chain b [Clavulina sp. PMI_390]
MRENDEVSEVMLSTGSETRSVPKWSLSPMNPPKFDRVDDVADLTHLNEASVVHNLRLRYGSGAIYTYSGLFLVAINPYTNLPLYTDSVVQQYRNKRKEENPPHIFSIAEQAWVSMGEQRENQSILITGESGAGKTENTKKVIQYLAAIATEHAPVATAAAPVIPQLTARSQFGPGQRAIASNMTGVSRTTTLGLLERQILQANPILEAFGNAQTQRNNNSSRFGKFVRISFARDNTIAGANIDWYLLEKSRVTSRNELERGFHVFYQLLSGGGTLKGRLLLDGDIDDYAILNKSRRQIDGVNDREEWRQLRGALDVVGFGPDEQFDLFRIVAAILHLGNIEINSDRSDQAHFTSPSQVEKACHLLGLPVAEFTKAVLRPRSMAGREWVTQARTKQQALDELASLSKTLYEKSFGAMVERINKALHRPSNKASFIGVLDIAGFEIFEVNSFEQLCINHTNERLQQFFNHRLFVLEQEEYARESIDWSFQNFGHDLQPTIDLIESREPIGILSLLDEECIMPKATDITFTEKLNSLWSPSDSDESHQHPGAGKYIPSRFAQGFVVTHYAGKVTYDTSGWLEKNKDPLHDNLTRVLSTATEPYIAQLFADYVEPGESFGIAALKKRVKKGAFRTVGQRHKEQLVNLMTQLNATQPHFVRCIVPNSEKKPGRIDVPSVLDQLRCNGVLEGIRIARLGYPNRLPFAEFRHQYEILTPGILPPGYMDGRKACTRMVDALDLERSSYAIGNSKIFFKAGVLAELEERRDTLLYDIISRIQSAARMFTARRQLKKILNRASAVRTIQRNARIYGELREWPWWQLFTKVRPLLAATRNDEELRRKELELALAKERAERDEREKLALETLKMELESEKQRVEAELAGERELTLDKDRMLERSRQREEELLQETTTLQSDLETLESQLDRAMATQASGEKKYTALKAAFDEAADHLTRLERAEKAWIEKEDGLMGEKTRQEAEFEAARVRYEQLEKELNDAKRALAEKEEDLARLKSRAETALSEMEAKLAAEVKARAAVNVKADDLERANRVIRDQLAELTQTTADYDKMVQKKEDDLGKAMNLLGTARSERDTTLKQFAELQARVETLTADLQVSDGARKQGVEARARLEEELDELRSLLEAKASEDTKRSEVERSKEVELADLRARITKIQQSAVDAKREDAAALSKLKIELESLQRDHSTATEALADLKARAEASEKSLAEATASLHAADKAKKAAEGELHEFRSKHIDIEGQLSEALKAKEALDRQLTVAMSKHQDFEDAVLQMERDKTSWIRQLESLRKQIETETQKRTQIEQAAKLQKREANELKDQNIKLERELKKALDDLHQRDWEVSQLRSKQDKTIVEHVHVLEEAKRVTDRQLALARKELEDLNGYVKSLEKAKTRLIGDAEDLTRQTERERQELKAREKAAKAQEDQILQARLDIESEKKAKAAAETAARRAEAETKNMQSQLAVLQQQLATSERSKAQLEKELATFVVRSDTPTSKRPMTPIDSSSQGVVDRVRALVEQQQTQLRRLIATQMPKGDSFKERLLKEIEESDQLLQQTFLSRGAGTTSVHEIRNLNNMSPVKRSTTPNGANGIIGTRSRNNSLPEPRASDTDTNNLRQQLQAMEVQMVASDRVRQHLQSSLKELSADVEKMDGSAQSMHNYRTRAAKDAERLKALMAEELEAQRLSESKSAENVKVLWTKYQTAIADERANSAKADDSRKALLAQQRAHQAELEDSRRQVAELLRSKQELQSTASDLQARLDRETGARAEATARSLDLTQKVKELEATSKVTSSASTEFRNELQQYKAKAAGYLSKLEAAEAAKASLVRTESAARQTVAEMERAMAEVTGERKAAEIRLRDYEQRIRDLENRLEKAQHGGADVEIFKRRLAEQMEEERDQYQKDLVERDFTMDQTRKKYQAELAQLSSELQSQRDTISRLREENRKTRGELDQLQLHMDDELYEAGTWKKEKERLETKITDVTSAYKTANSAQGEQQSQIVNLLGQVRELRGVLDEAEADRTALQQARRNLERRLNEIAQGRSASTDKLSNDRALQALTLEKQDLVSSLDEQRDRTARATDRLRKSEVHLVEFQSELQKSRQENSQLERRNAELEKQIKDLNVRVVDHETKSYSSHTKRLEAQVQELRTKLDLAYKERAEAVTRAASTGGGDRELQARLIEMERGRARLEAEVKSYETKITKLRSAMDDLQTSESEMQLAKRRSDRDAADQRQRALGLEREVERLRARLERPSLGGISSNSPASSPRK